MAAPSARTTNRSKKMATSVKKPPSYTPSTLRRYTKLAALVHLLRNKNITLLNPASWDDKNDAHFMAEYKRHRKLQTALAICFANAKETYHHWHVFSHGSDGVCVTFVGKPLIAAFGQQEGITFGKVRYELIQTVSGWPELKVSQLPFLKRKPYEPEKEYRAIYEHETESAEHFDVPIELKWIKTITLSPWMPSAFQTAVKDTLRSIPGCENLHIVRSTLVSRESWKALASKAVL